MVLFKNSLSSKIWKISIPTGFPPNTHIVAQCMISARKYKRSEDVPESRYLGCRATLKELCISAAFLGISFDHSLLLEIRIFGSAHQPGA